MNSQNKVARRLDELRRQKEVLRAVQEDLPQQSHASQPALLTPTRPIADPLQIVQKFVQPPPKSFQHLKSTSVNFPPKPTSSAPSRHVDSQPEVHSKQSRNSAPVHNRSQNPRKPRPPRIPDLIGAIGVKPALPTISTDDSPVSDALDDTVVSTSRQVEGAPLRFEASMSDKVMTENRPVIAMRLHRKYDNVLLAAHGSRTHGRPSPAQGVIAVWSLDLPQPSLQRSLVSSAPISALEVFPLSPTLVLAGTSIGSVLMWDLRVQTALPISAFDPDFSDLRDCHARRPVKGLRTTVTSSPFFISTSTSGHVCKWSLSQPQRPLSQTVLLDTVSSGSVLINTIDLPASTYLSADERKIANRAPSFFAGTLQGEVCRVEADGRSWSVASERGEHNTTVTAVRAHPAGIGAPFLDDIIATSAHDWSVNVWSFRRGQSCSKLWSYDNISNGIVNDVAWSSAHPTVLCSGDESGVLSLFDLSGRLQNAKTLSSTWRFGLPERTGRKPITSLQWSNNDRFICAGDAEGNVHIWSTTSTLASLPDADWTAHFLKSKVSRID